MILPSEIDSDEHQWRVFVPFPLPTGQPFNGRVIDLSGEMVSFLLSNMIVGRWLNQITFQHHYMLCSWCSANEHTTCGHKLAWRWPVVTQIGARAQKRNMSMSLLDVSASSILLYTAYVISFHFYGGKFAQTETKTINGMACYVRDQRTWILSWHTITSDGNANPGKLAVHTD